MPKLNDRIGFYPRIMRIGQAARFHGAVTQRFASTCRHHLDRQAPIKVRCVLFPFFEICRVAFNERIKESIILRLVHRAIYVVLAGATRAEFVIARLVPANIHIDAVAINNRRNGIEESQLIAARHFPDSFRQGGGGKRAGGDNHMLPIGRNFRHFFALNCNIRMRFNVVCHGLRKAFAVNSQRATCRHLMRVSAGHNKALAVAQFGMQQTYRIGFGVVGTKRIGTHQLGQPVGDMGIGFTHRAHFMQHHLNTGGSRLPCRFGTGQSAANNVKYFAHALQIHGLVEEWKSVH